MHARRIDRDGVDAARETLARIALLDLSRELVGRVVEPFPAPVRTLDALHLASMQFLADQGVELHLASYDERMRAAAKALGFGLFRLD